MSQMHAGACRWCAPNPIVFVKQLWHLAVLITNMSDPRALTAPDIAEAMRDLTLPVANVTQWLSSCWRCLWSAARWGKGLPTWKCYLHLHSIQVQCVDVERPEPCWTKDSKGQAAGNNWWVLCATWQIYSVNQRLSQAALKSLSRRSTSYDAHF